MEGKLAKKHSNRAQAETDLLRLVEKILQESGDAENFNASAWLQATVSESRDFLYPFLAENLVAKQPQQSLL